MNKPKSTKYAITLYGMTDERTGLPIKKQRLYSNGTKQDAKYFAAAWCSANNFIAASVVYEVQQ